MASVFTYDPNPPKVSSPWPGQPASDLNSPSTERAIISSIADLAGFGITKLEAEPQEGPTEYKLHLLLRPRRSFVKSSTSQNVSGSHQSKSRALQSDTGSEMRQIRSSSSPVPSNQSRQNRLQHLTTQLLWRLQQSSPYHSSSRSDLVVPVLPQAETNLKISGGPEKLLPGLEESQGALYELGVSDDGTFIGITEDELDESLMTLRAMAFSLGCTVRLLRKITVGDCQWNEEVGSPNCVIRHLRHENLFVAEALVFPDLDFCQHVAAVDNPLSSSAPFSSNGIRGEQSESQTEQLRISLTGSTTSGKSSLLGTLSTSTLDNGRGKSRLSLLKHRHEIASGISSSVTPELIGYHDIPVHDKTRRTRSTVINYASRNVSSWNDIHSSSEPGRLVLVTDSAGHPRYRRTAVRGLVSWAPHWTMCCIAADSDEGSLKQDEMGVVQDKISGTAGFNSSMAYLILCLRLNLPLIVVVTKLDLASKTELRQMLDKVLSTLKYAGRTPTFVQKNAAQAQDIRLQSIATEDKETVMSAIASCGSASTHLIVPIVFTSSVNGIGISRIHALLRHLPIPHKEPFGIDNKINHDSLSGKVLFHVDEVFSKSDCQSQQSQSCDKSQVIILSGYLRHGDLTIGDTFFIGPFTGGSTADTVKLRRADSLPEIIKQTSQRSLFTKENDRPSPDESLITVLHSKRSFCSSPSWQKAHVVSLRNLRLPVRKLLAGQVGTVGVTWDDPRPTNSDQPLNMNRCVRKGMVVIRPGGSFDGQHPSSYSGFIAVFDAKDRFSLLPGSLVIAYIASVRATARVLSIDSGLTASKSSTTQPQQQQAMTLQFVASREWIELNTQVLIMAECRHGQGRYMRKEGVDTWSNGFVGRITQILE